MKNLLYLIFLSFLLLPTYQVWANAAPEGMALIKKGCFMIGTNKIYDYLSFDPNTPERPKLNARAPCSNLQKWSKIINEEGRTEIGVANGVYILLLRTRTKNVTPTNGS